MKLRTKIIWIFFTAAPLVYTAVYLYSVYKKPLTLISEKTGLKSDFIWNTYTDKLHQGKSEIFKRDKDSLFAYEYQLKDGYKFKFALISITGRHFENINLSGYNTVDINLKAEQGSGILFYIYTRFPQSKKLNSPSMPHQYILNADTAFTTVSLSLDEMYTPDWWYSEVNETKTSLGKPHFEQTLALSFGNCIYMKPGSKDVVTIKNLIFSVSLLSYFLKILPYILGYYCLLTWYFILNKRKNKKLVFVENNPLVMDKTKTDEELVFYFIGIHYFEPAYDIESLSQQSRLPEAVIVQVIKNKTGLTFKQFLNNIRINEAERLLSETDLPVNELAEKVGFNTREHFNRLFKSQTGRNPLEVRKNKTKIKPAHALQ